MSRCPLGCVSLSFADFDGDSFVDMAVGGAIYKHGGSGYFGMGINPYSGGASTNPAAYQIISNAILISWADYDADGLVDLFAVGPSHFWSSSGPVHGRLFRNTGSSTDPFQQVATNFTEEDASFWAVEPGTTMPSDAAPQINSATWADLDGNGFPDLFLTVHYEMQPSHVRS